MTVDVQTIDSLDIILNWVSAHLANHSYRSLWIPLKKILCISIKIYLPNQSYVIRLGFLFWASAKSFSWSSIHFWISVFDGNHLDIPSSKFKSQKWNHLLARGQTQGLAPRAHQQALTTGPFRNTCEADVVSFEVDIRGLQERDIYNQRKCQVDLTQE